MELRWGFDLGERVNISSISEKELHTELTHVFLKIDFGCPDLMRRNGMSFLLSREDIVTGSKENERPQR